MERGLPSPEFRLRKSHAFFLVDLVIAAFIFVGTGNYYMSHYGASVLAKKAATRAAIEAENAKLLAQADSVMAYKTAEVESMRADSLAKYQELEAKVQYLGASQQEQGQLSQRVLQLSDVVQELKVRTQQSAGRAAEYEQNVDDRSKTLAALGDDAEKTDARLKETHGQRVDAAQKLTEAKSLRTYEPDGVLPDKAGVSVAQEVGDSRLTSVEGQYIVRNTPKFDFGLAVGVGIGTGDRASTKKLGVLVSRSLIHRRLGLDLGAGFAYLTDQDGAGKSDPFAAAALRYSPFYKERFHFNLGAMAGQGETFKPFIGIGMGRR